jgi:hypothetical protein
MLSGDHEPCVILAVKRKKLVNSKGESSNWMSPQDDDRPLQTTDKKQLIEP